MSSLVARDRRLVWHPFSQAKTAPPPLGIQRGQGAYLYDENGTRYLDLIASWWVNLHGHSHPAIVQAIANQAAQLEHVIFSGFTHEPAVDLCERLSSHLPPALCRYFFSDNGSTAVEVAMKIAYQAAWNQHRIKPMFLSFEGGYHGDTLGAMSAGRGSGFHDPFKPLMCETITLPYPHTWRHDPDAQAKETHALAALGQALETHHHHTAALILEPLIQGAGGMRMCRPSFVQEATRMAQAHGVLVIFDEIMTGFGRTGRCFAYEHTDAVPDLLCLSKGLTGGFLPLALTVVSQRLYDAFWDDDYCKAFLHGHSYTANPLGCAAALASWRLLHQPDTQAALDAIASTHATQLPRLAASAPCVTRIRQTGTVAAWEIHTTQGSSSDAARHIAERARTHGVLLRPLGSTLYMIPPYVTPPEALHQAYDVLCDVCAAIPSDPAV